MSLIRFVLICALATLQLVAGQQQQEQQKILRATKCDKMVVTSPANEESSEVKELCEKCCKNEGADLLSTVSEPSESSDPDKPRFCRCFVWGAAAPAPAPAAPQQPPAAYPYPAQHPYGQQPAYPYGPPPPHAYGPPPPAWGQHPYGYPPQGAYPPQGYPPPAYPPYGYQPGYGPPPQQYVQQGNNGGGLMGQVAATAGGVVLGEVAADWIEDEFFDDE